MSMGIFDSTKSKPLAELALAARSLKQDVISSNIANIDTPFYKAKDVSFEETLKEKALQMYGEENSQTQTLKMAQTDEKHLSGVSQNTNSIGTIYLRDGHIARNDANTVDLDVETSELSKNAVMINALSKALTKQSAIFKSVLDASDKV